MKLFDYIRIMPLFDKLIKNQCTGTPNEFCRRLEISRTFLYDCIDEFRSRDVINPTGFKT